MTRREIETLPIGQVCDQIACHRIAHGAKGKTRSGALSLFDQTG